MPDKIFLETYPLYKKFHMDLPRSLSAVATPAIRMQCEAEGSLQTFNAPNNFLTNSDYPDILTNGKTLSISYVCNSCNKFRIGFFINFDSDAKYVMKVGQYPPWSITPDPLLAKILGPRTEYYSKALICESQNYGIAAFSYYRRIVEEIIDELLDGVLPLLNDSDKVTYSEVLSKVKTTTITQEKIELVKDILPPILRPNGMNPLSTLHETLSEGLHAKSDDHCIELAGTIRDILLFLVSQIEVTNLASMKFSDSMRKLLDKKRQH